MHTKKVRALTCTRAHGRASTRCGRALTLLVLALGLLTSGASADAGAAPSVTLESADFRAKVSTLNTGVTSFAMKDPRYERGGQPIDLVTTDKPQFFPLRFTVKGVDLEKSGPWEVLDSSPTVARLQARRGELTFVRKLEVGSGPYQVWSTMRIENAGKAPRKLELTFDGHHYVRREDEEGAMFGRTALTASALCVNEEGPERVEREDAVDETVENKGKLFSGKVPFGAVDTVYFTQAVAAEGTKFTSCRVLGSDRGGTPDDPHGTLLSVELTHPAVTVPAGGHVTVRTLHFVGPKLPEPLAAAGHQLRRANYVGGLPGIDAIATSLVRLLSYIHDHIPNWGLAIILLTLLVKLVLYPLTAKSYESMGEMRKLKPEIDRINEKFADDREKKGAAMMELYKSHKINPLGGCLPQLLQLPIWWGLYMSLSSNVELFKRPFFGFWQDLAAPDPYYVLPVALGALMWVQQKITPSTMDPAQAKMMLYLMPTMMTVFMLFLPAGLCLYMLTNSVLSIAQQRFIEYRLSVKSPVAPTATGGGSGSPSGAGSGAASPGRTGRGRA
jgi:YidC/Oxa1 family membrane protein insertase